MLGGAGFLPSTVHPWKMSSAASPVFLKAPIIGNGKNNIASGTKAQISGEPCQFLGDHGDRFLEVVRNGDGFT